MARPDKAAAVAELTEDFKSATATVLTEYRGLTVSSMKELRRSLGAGTSSRCPGWRQRHQFICGAAF